MTTFERNKKVLKYFFFIWISDSLGFVAGQIYVAKIESKELGIQDSSIKNSEWHGWANIAFPRDRIKEKSIGIFPSIYCWLVPLSLYK